MISEKSEKKPVAEQKLQTETDKENKKKKKDKKENKNKEDEKENNNKNKRSLKETTNNNKEDKKKKVKEAHTPRTPTRPPHAWGKVGREPSDAKLFPDYPKIDPRLILDRSKPKSKQLQTSIKILLKMILA